MVLDELDAPLAELVRSVDGVRSTAELLADVAEAGADAEQGAAVLADLHGAGLLRENVAPDPGPAGWHRTAVAADATAWSVHGDLPAATVLRRRAAATVQVTGGGRVGVAAAIALATAGVGQVTVHASGVVRPTDLGTGYRPEDIDTPRVTAMREAIARAAPMTAPANPPDVVLITDAVAVDPQRATDLVAAGVPHLPGYAHEGRAIVGPLVQPGRSGCLRCVHLWRADTDPAWPKLAAQLVRLRPITEPGWAQLAALLATEQILGVLAGPDAGLGRPPIWGACLELDPVNGTLRRTEQPAHPRCGCGAAGSRHRPGAAR